MKLFGTVLPWIGNVISPCDADGTPAMSEDEVASAQWECRSRVFAWLGRAFVVGTGDVSPRMVDPANPRRFAPGNL